MSDVKKLTKRQLAVVEDLFAGELDEQAVLEKHKIQPLLYERWLADARFLEYLEGRMMRMHLQGRMVLACYVPLAAAKLIKLTDSEKEETARKACLDILYPPGMSGPAPSSVAGAPRETTGAAPNLSPEAASRLLAALAESSEGNQAGGESCP